MKPQAYLVTLTDGRSSVAYGLTHGTAKNRGAKILGSKKRDVHSCFRQPDSDKDAPDEDQLRQKNGRPLPAGVFEIEKTNPHERFCTHCRQFHAIEQFSMAPTNPGRECKTCRSARWGRMSHTARVEQLVSMARHRARSKGIPFALSASDICIPERCPVLDIPIQFSDVANRHSSPSLDRIKPELGYVPGNVLVVSWLANDIRRNFKPADISKVGAFYGKLLNPA